MITTLGAGNRTETKNMKTQIEEIWYDGGGYPDAANVTVTQGRGYAEIWLHMEHTHARVGDEVILEADLGDGGSHLPGPSFHCSRKPHGMLDAVFVALQAPLPKTLVEQTTRHCSELPACPLGTG